MGAWGYTSFENDDAMDWLGSVRYACAQREFNIGYDCGVEPWAFNQGLSAAVLGRLAAAGASLRITIYPDRAADHAESHNGPDVASNP